MSNINTCISAHTHTWVLPLCLSIHTHTQQMDYVQFHSKVTYLLYMYQVSGDEV